MRIDRKEFTTMFSMVRNSQPHGFTIKELLVVTFIIGALLFLFLPSLNRHAPGAARRVRCMNQLKQLVLAMHNYHDTHGYFPAAMGGSGAGGNENRLNGFVALLPQLEQGALYDEIHGPLVANGVSYPSMGPKPSDANYPPWQMQLEILKCPSAPSATTGFGTANYAFCIGDITTNIHNLPTVRGASAPGHMVMLKDISDGLSNTILLGEIGTASRRLALGQFAVNIPATVLTEPDICTRTLDGRKRAYLSSVKLHPDGRGYNWADGAAGPGLFNTILPPNSPSCAVNGTEAVDGVYSAGSYHPRGCLMGFADCSVRFISEKIDAGDPKQPPPTPEQLTEGSAESPYGVWGSLGSRAGAEDLSNADY